VCIPRLRSGIGANLRQLRELVSIVHQAGLLFAYFMTTEVMLTPEMLKESAS